MLLGPLFSLLQELVTPFELTVYWEGGCIVYDHPLFWLIWDGFDQRLEVSLQGLDHVLSCGCFAHTACCRCQFLSEGMQVFIWTEVRDLAVLGKQLC